MTPSRRTSFTTSVRVINWIHHNTTNGRTDASPTLCPALPSWRRLCSPFDTSPSVARIRKALCASRLNADAKLRGALHEQPTEPKHQLNERFAHLYLASIQRNGSLNQLGYFEGETTANFNWRIFTRANRITSLHPFRRNNVPTLTV